MNTMADKVKMKVNIAGRFYPMSVNTDEEETIRKAGKEINAVIRDFEQKYNIRDKQDALAMCALQFVAKSLEKSQSEQHDDDEIKNRLRMMIDRLQQQI